MLVKKYKRLETQTDLNKRKRYALSLNIKKLHQINLLKIQPMTVSKKTQTKVQTKTRKIFDNLHTNLMHLKTSAKVKAKAKRNSL